MVFDKLKLSDTNIFFNLFIKNRTKGKDSWVVSCRGLTREDGCWCQVWSGSPIPRSLCNTDVVAVFVQVMQTPRYRAVHTTPEYTCTIYTVWVLANTRTEWVWGVGTGQSVTHGNRGCGWGLPGVKNREIKECVIYIMYISCNLVSGKFCQRTIYQCNNW